MARRETVRTGEKLGEEAGEAASGAAVSRAEGPGWAGGGPHKETLLLLTSRTREGVENGLGNFGVGE